MYRVTTTYEETDTNRPSTISECFGSSYAPAVQPRARHVDLEGWKLGSLSEYYGGSGVADLIVFAQYGSAVGLLAYSKDSGLEALEGRPLEISDAPCLVTPTEKGLQLRVDKAAASPESY